MRWKKDDPSDKDAVRLVEALLSNAEKKPTNVIDMTKRIKRKPRLTVVDPDS